MDEVLVTGGAGFIGSHIAVELARSGYAPVLFDNLSNASPAVLGRINELAGRALPFIAGDVRRADDLSVVFERHAITAVIHCAGRKSVAESVRLPMLYYDHNVNGSRVLLESMARYRCRVFIFSSSATVYGETDQMPLTERAALGRPCCPYGQTKLIVEYMAGEFQHAEPHFAMCMLRYFNPVGAHPSGLLGEDPADPPANLMPIITQVAVGRRAELQIFGQDYPTADGTCVRDYIHVVDLARGHVCALRHCRQPGVRVYNLGTGTGCSVLHMVQTFARVTGCRIAYRFVPRRPGDVAQCYADPGLARQELGWSAERTLEDMVADAFRWQQRNPRGYAG